MQQHPSDFGKPRAGRRISPSDRFVVSDDQRRILYCAALRPTRYPTTTAAVRFVHTELADAPVAVTNDDVLLSLCYRPPGYSLAYEDFCYRSHR
jgi:hypothetical protein